MCSWLVFIQVFVSLGNYYIATPLAQMCLQNLGGYCFLIQKCLDTLCGYTAQQ